MADAASVTDEPQVQTEGEKLKYLEFVEEAITQAIDYASKVYEFAKEKSGPLKPGVETIETTLKTVVGPAYEKYHDVPVVVLKFVDRKVDESVTQIDGVLPPIVKDATKVGVVETAKEFLEKIDPVAEKYASSAWSTVNQLPLVASTVKALTPSAALVTEKYNQTVKENASFLPLVPTDKIARVFSIPEKDAEKPEPAVVPGGEEEAAEEVAGGGGAE
uniref:Small rubber particle protein SRPP5 n=2 Tax=Taraxacum TaxID=49743 RepID=M9PNM8_9ASTR|nr:small rubber particle protein SRPP5 [Taraxacum brevicorniculatum]AMB19725.1 small rubber particle protein 5 [Taraxacum kok-saghyz]